MNSPTTVFATRTARVPPRLVWSPIQTLVSTMKPHSDKARLLSSRYFSSFTSATTIPSSISLPPTYARHTISCGFPLFEHANPHTLDKVYAKRSKLVLQDPCCRVPSRGCASLSNVPRSPILRAMSTSQDTDSFYAAQDIDFASLGIDSAVVNYLNESGFTVPTKVQEAVIPNLLAGEDIILAAETGSGKTLAYLAPLLHKFITEPSPEFLAVRDGAKPGIKGEGKGDTTWPLAQVLVLCPNQALCDQVAEVGRALGGEYVQKLTVDQGLYRVRAPILLSTPALLLNEMLHPAVPTYRRETFFRSIRHVVVDEADMVMAGGFSKDMKTLFQLLARYKPFAQADLLEPAQPALEQPAGEPEREVGSVIGGESIKPAAREDVLASAEAEGELRWPQEEERSQGRAKKKKDEDERPTLLRQYVFVAATMPQNGKKTIGQELRRLFPDARWMEGSLLHRSSPRVEHAWLDVRGDRQKPAALLRAVQSAADAAGSTMVFCKSTAAAQAHHATLLDAGVQAGVYYSSMPAREKEASLGAFRAGRVRVLVCTDMAARGIDIPLTQHVVQADFAASAVDFIHRIGRTARAGNVGKVTNIITDDDKLLAEALRVNLEAGMPVEDAFSRKRSFRTKYKKYGASRKAPTFDQAKHEAMQARQAKQANKLRRRFDDKKGTSIR